MNRLSLLFVAGALLASLSGCGTTPAQCEGAACETTCPPAQRLCSGVCRDLQLDPGNCGTCGTVCSAGQLCSSGQCTPTCAAPLSECSALCVNIQHDPANCGRCGTTCDTGFCVNGQCGAACPAPLTECPVRQCINIQNDLANCGGCGLTCAPLNATGGACNAGNCSYVACRPGFIDCDGSALNGCESTIAACPAVLVSVAMDGGAANGRSYNAVVDNSGTKVAFISEASNLVANDTNGIADAFLRDITAGTTVRISTLPNGGEINPTANGGPPVFSNSFGNQVAISGDGKVVAILTAAPMISPDTNGGGNDVVVLEADGGRSYGMLGGGGTSQPSGNTEACCLFMSKDDRFVSWATRSGASLVAPGNNEFNIFSYDRRSKRVTHSSPAANGGYVTSGGNGWNAFTGFVSSNGRFTTYGSLGDQIIANEFWDGCAHWYLRDGIAGVNSRMTTDANGVALNCSGLAPSGSGVSITPDGTLAAMVTNQLGGPTAGRSYLYSRDMATKQWTLLSVGVDGGTNGDVSYAQTYLSDDGTIVSFSAAASNLTTDDTNGAGVDCYAYNRETQKELRLNGPVAVASPDGGTGCGAQRLNAAGTHVVFETQDALRPNDTFNNTDVYVRRVR